MVMGTNRWPGYSYPGAERKRSKKIGLNGASLASCPSDPDTEYPGHPSFTLHRNFLSEKARISEISY